jgi:ubiquinone/menaquinone biosynthesis C-methylase UbiE
MKKKNRDRSDEKMKNEKEEIEEIEETENKVEYGWYLKNVMFILILIGTSGIGMIILSVFFGGLLRLFLLPSGIAIVLMFLWPALGVLTMNLITGKNISHPTISFPEILNLESPKILDIGCGTGRVAIGMAKNLKNGGHIYGIDIFDSSISNNALETVKRNAKLENVEKKTTFQYGSATDIPFEDNFFDVVNISYVLHEIREKPQVLSEIIRTLKPGGTLYLTELQRASISTLLLMGPMCMTCKSKKFWYELFDDNGFKQIKHVEKGPIVIFTAIP